MRTSISQGSCLKVDKMKFGCFVTSLEAFKEGIQLIFEKLDGPFSFLLIGNSFPFLMEHSDSIVDIDHKLIEVTFISLPLELIVYP